MPPKPAWKPITFDESALPASKPASTTTSKPTAGTAVSDHQAPNPRARKPITDRITAATGSSAPPPPTAATIPRDHPEQASKAKESSVARTDTGMSSQPRENQPWINKMKRPTPDGVKARDAAALAEDRKRRRSNQRDLAPMPAVGNRGSTPPKSRPQQDNTTSRAIGPHAGLDHHQPSGPVKGSRQAPAREGSTLHVLESGVKVTRSQPRAGSHPGEAGPSEFRAAAGRSEQMAEHNIPGTTSWHAVIEQAREKAVQETNRVLADASDHLRALLMEKVHTLADLCGFVVHIKDSPTGEIVAQFTHASRADGDDAQAPLEVPDSPPVAGYCDQLLPNQGPSADGVALISPEHSPSPRAVPAVERFEQEGTRQEKLPLVPLSARIEHGNEAPMSFHRRGERETPPLPEGEREPSPDDVEEVHHDRAMPGVPASGQRAQNVQHALHRGKGRLPSPPRGGRGMVHASGGGRRDDRIGRSISGRGGHDVYLGDTGSHRGPSSGRGWVRDSGRRNGRDRGGYHDSGRRNQRR